MPQHEFELSASLTQLAALGGAPLASVSLEFSLHAVLDDDDESEGFINLPAAQLPASIAADDTPLATCTATTATEGGARTACALSLPAMGRVRALVCTVDDGSGGRSLCSSIMLGQTAAAWAAAPLTEYLQRAVVPEAEVSAVTVGGTAKLHVVNPLTTSLGALVLWGNQLQRRSLRPAPLAPGAAVIELDVGSECEGGCQVQVFLVASADVTRSLPVPTSPLLDATLPMLGSHALSLSAPSAAASDTLQLTLTPWNTVQEPGTMAGVNISLTDATGNPVAGEVAIFAVDRALLQLKAHPTLDLPAAFQPSLDGEAYRQSSSFEQLTSAAGLNYSAAVMLSRLSTVTGEPWLSAEWSLRPEPGSLVERNWAALLKGAANTLTEWGNANMGRDGSYPVGGLVGMGMGGGAEYDFAAAPEMAMAEDSMGGQPPSAAANRNDKSFRVGEDDGGGEADGRGGSGAMAVRSEFLGTPLFVASLQVDASGFASLPWQLPDNLGSFELRAYAASGTRFGGAATAEQTVRRLVSASASVPRVARVGDRFRCGVSLTVAPDAPTAGLQLHVEMTLSPPTAAAAWPLVLQDVGTGEGGSQIVAVSTTEQEITMSPSETAEVAFEVAAVAVGEAVAVVRVWEGSADEGASRSSLDALELRIPVLGSQPAVTIATSRALEATAEASPWEEGLAPPTAAPGSGSLSVSIGLGRLPAVQAVARGLRALPHRWERDYANDLLAALAPGAMLAQYGDEDPANAVDADLVARLQALTTAQTGLLYSSSSLRYDRGVSLQLNAFALLVVRKLELAGLPIPSALTALKTTWTAALRSGLTASVDRMRTYCGHYNRGTDCIWRDHETLAACRLALGRAWSLSGYDELSMATLDTHAAELSTAGQAAYVLSHLYPASPDDDAQTVAPGTAVWAPAWDGAEHGSKLQPLLSGFIGRLRVTARTAYIARVGGGAASAGVRDNALALAALSTAKRAGAPAALATNLDKLANFVARGGDAAGVSSAHAGWAMADYDVASQSAAGADVSFSLLLCSEPQPLHTEQLTSGVSPPPPFIISLDALADAPAALPPPATAADATAIVAEVNVPPSSPSPPLLFVAKGTGEVAVALELEFVPAAALGGAVYRGIEVDKVIRLYDSLAEEPYGPPLATAPLGAVVTVTLQIYTPDELTNVVVEDWLPAGLEALDTNLDNFDGGREDSDRAWPWFVCGWWRCSSFSRETHKDRVRYFAAWLAAGTHTLSYEAIAATRGAFVLPPTKAEATLQPEVMGLSATSNFVVHEGPAVAVPPPAAALPCPADCSGRGRCNGATGQCVCDAASAGEDCTEPRAALALSMAPTLYLPFGEPEITVKPTLVASDSAAMTPVPPAHVCVATPTPMARVDGTGSTATATATATAVDIAADACLPALAREESADGGFVLVLRRPSEECVCPTEEQQWLVSGSADGVMFDSTVVTLSIGCDATSTSRPPPLSPSPPPATHLVTMAATISASVSDITATVLTGMRQRVAEQASVPLGAVQATVEAASVKITFTLALQSGATANAVQTSLSGSFASKAAASALLSTPALAVTVEAINAPPEVTVLTALASPRSPSPRSPSPPPPLAPLADQTAKIETSNEAVIAAAVPAAVAALLLVVVGGLVLRCRMARRIQTSKTSSAGPLQQAAPRAGHEKSPPLVGETEVAELPERAVKGSPTTYV